MTGRATNRRGPLPVTNRRATSLVTLYGRTYLDAEVEVPLAKLAQAKGKVDVVVTAVLGGFGCNAARALDSRLPAGALRLVTVTSWLDWPRLRGSLPASVTLDPILDGVGTIPAWPPISVIINPAGECRLLREPSDDDAALWALDRVPSRALDAPLHILGRVPRAFVAELLAHRDGLQHAPRSGSARPGGAAMRIAWCGGDALSIEHEAAMDLLCVNTAEAGRLLGTTDRSTTELARGLAVRARAPGAVRLVTGRGESPAVAAVREARGVRCYLGAPPTKIVASRVKRLKGVGDVFAASFLVDACFDPRGQANARLDVIGALASAQRAASRFITSAVRP